MPPSECDNEHFPPYSQLEHSPWRRGRLAVGLTGPATVPLLLRTLGSTGVYVLNSSHWNIGPLRALTYKQLGALTQDEQIPCGRRFDGMVIPLYVVPRHTMAIGMPPWLTTYRESESRCAIFVSLCLALCYGV